MRKDYEIVGSYNNQRILNIDSERNVNLFEYIDINGKRPKTLIPTSGLDIQKATFQDALKGVRAAFYFKDITANNTSHIEGVYVVVGNQFYIIKPDFSVDKLNPSPLATDTGYVGIDANQHQVMFVDGINGYIFNVQTGIFTVKNSSDPFTPPNIAFPIRPIDVSNLDGYFVIASGDTPNWYISELNNGLVITAFASITSHPGNIVACRTLHRRLFLFSEFFTEVWENAGLGSDIPFRRNNTLLMEVGTPSVGSISTGFDRMFFLSQTRDGLDSIIKVRGYEPIPVSNKALDYQLSQYDAFILTGTKDARGIVIKENGLIFYRINFTNANHTFVLNVSMSSPQDPKWHEEEVLNGDRHPAQVHFFFRGNNYYGHYNLPIIYKVNPNNSTNNGETIRRMRIGKPITPEGYNRLRIDRFHLDLVQGIVETELGEETELLQENGSFSIDTESGIPLITEVDLTQFRDHQPVVFLSYSKDGGRNYGNELIAPMGKIGERTFRTVWRKLGTIPRGQSFVPRIQFFHQIPFIILGAAWDFEIMPE